MLRDAGRRTQRRWQRFRRLSADERHVFMTAWWRMPAVALGLRVAGLRRVERAIARRPMRPRRPDETLTPEEIARLVHAAAQAGPLRPTCLTQSLTLLWILRQRAMPAEITFGVLRAERGRGLSAHAWVECSGRPLDEPALLASGFRRLDLPASTEAPAARRRPRIGSQRTPDVE